MVICSAEQSHERVGQLPYPDPSGGSFLQSSCRGEGDGCALHRNAQSRKTCVSLGIHNRDTQSDHSEDTHTHTHKTVYP